MTADGPKVSILINNHNYGHFVGDAIDSALAQTYGSCETVVVDDGSTDGSVPMIEGYGEAVRLVTKDNGGQASAFNAGFAVSSGELVMLLDADDLFEPTKVQRVVDEFRSDGAAGWVFHATTLLNVHDGTCRPSKEAGEARRIDFRRAIRRGTMPDFAPATSALAFRRELLRQILPMPTHEGTSADRYLKLMAIALAPGRFLGAPLAVQRIHSKNAYTGRPDGLRVAAKAQVMTAGWIRRRCPELERLADKLLAQGIGFYQASGGFDPRYRAAVRRYLRNAGLRRRLMIELRAAWHCLRWRARVAARGGRDGF